MKTVLHTAESRGHANHGWLDSRHTFSFANYYNPERMHFGELRVLNDDWVEAGRGFGTHPHDNMEIISIPLEGDLEHRDSMGNTMQIRQNDIQVLSAGTGITHSEYNGSKHNKVNFLQIWVFPNQRQLQPSYDQKTFSANERKNKLVQIVSPKYDPEGITINQDAWFSLANFDSGKQFEYEVKKKGNGVYLFLISGSIIVGDQLLKKRDGYGMWDLDRFSAKILADAEVLVMEVPMK